MTCKFAVEIFYIFYFFLISLFKKGLSEFKVVLGDSNLKLELPYGVQEHNIEKAVVHENYDINDSLHQNDIGEFDIDI